MSNKLISKTNTLHSIVIEDTKDSTTSQLQSMALSGNNREEVSLLLYPTNLNINVSH